MLRQRVVTAVIMAALFLAAVATLDLIALAILFGVVAAAAVWEWSSLAGWSKVWQRGVYTALFLVLLCVLWLICGLGQSPDREVLQPWLGVACLFWSIAMLLVESYPGSSWLWRNTATRSLMGWLILAATWLATLFLLTLPGGTLLMIILVIAVAAADIGAYFSGRRWGRHKLAPSVSPGKTWEGLWGGL
ncbi:MAG: phosphatidate cytidylyltransferase, partial [Luminiphilus sp.]|nr:phosphatidate cytidylyltransferase [Luminiphilus sp.]